MHALEINDSGQTNEREVLRKDIAGEFGMYTRDLRPVFSIKQLSTITPRENGIILNLWEIKMIVGQKKVVLFNTDYRQITDEFIPQLIQRITNTETSSSFEMRILDFTFGYVYQYLFEEFRKFEKGIHKTLYKLKKTTSDQYFELLLNHKKHLNKLQILVREVEESTEEILKDEEDMRLLCMGKDQIEEAESVLEHAWEQLEDLSHKIHELDEHVDDTQDFITLKMANRRNLIIRFDLFATLITATLSGLAVITGIFGMNLKNTYEGSAFVFYGITAAVVILFLIATFFSYWYLKKKNIW